MGKCKKCKGNGEPHDEQKALDRAGDEIAREIDKEAMLYAGNMMSGGGYSEGSLDHPGFKETQARWHALFKELGKSK